MTVPHPLYWALIARSQCLFTKGGYPWFFIVSTWPVKFVDYFFGTFRHLSVFVSQITRILQLEEDLKIISQKLFINEERHEHVTQLA